MPGFENGTLLFYGGMIGMTLATVSAVVATIVLHISGKRLKNRLKEEYGKRRH